MDQSVQPIVASPPTVQGRLSDLLATLGVESSDSRLCESCLIPLRRVRAGAPLFHEGTRAESVHVVKLGTFKILRLADDGYEQVLGFAGQGEVIGFDALHNGVHPSSALALEDSSVYALPMRELDTLRRRVSELDHALQSSLSAQLAGSAGIAEVMAAVASEVRLARFLLQRSARMQACGQSSRRLRLPMSRRDIASHLGVAHETVSRSFGELAGWGYLSVDNREVEIIDPQGLRALARNTRGFVEERPARAGHGRARLARPIDDCSRAR